MCVRDRQRNRGRQEHKEKDRQIGRLRERKREEHKQKVGEKKEYKERDIQRERERRGLTERDKGEQTQIGKNIQKRCQETERLARREK